MAKPNFTLPNKPAIKSGSILSYNYTDDFTFVPTPLTFNRDSAATRVNEKGLIEDVGYFGPELVQNGDFSQEGSELVTNGDFATDSDWLEIGGANINTTNKNVVFSNVISGGVLQNNIFQVGHSYKVSFEITSIESGTGQVRFDAGGGTVISGKDKVGVYSATFTYTSSAASDRVYIVSDSGTVNLTVDNVSVKEVGQNWTQTGANWSFGNNKAIADGTSQGSLQQSISTVAVGSKYKINYTISDYVSGNIRFYLGGVFTNYVTSNGIYSETITATSTDAIFQTSIATPFTGSITNISVVEVLGDKPRIDYSDSLTEPSLLLEPQSTNLITYSEDFSQWQKLNSTVTGNSVISPDGSKNADLIDYNITSSNGYIRISHTASSVVSFYVKYKDIQWLMVYGSGLGAGKFIDIENSVIGGNVGSGVSAEITNSGNGWKRVVLKSSSSNITQTSIYAASSDGSYATISLSGGVYLWGAQAETLSYPTSYIPTYGSTATRLGETAKNAGDVNVFNSEEGVLYVEVAALSNDVINKRISISDGTNLNRINMFFNGNINTYAVSSNGAGNVITNSTNPILNNKIAISYNGTSVKTYINGSQIDSSTFGGFNSNTLDVLSFTNGNGGDPFYGKVKNVQVFNKALTDRELEILTIQ